MAVSSAMNRFELFRYRLSVSNIGLSETYKLSPQRGEDLYEKLIFTLAPIVTIGFIISLITELLRALSMRGDEDEW